MSEKPGIMIYYDRIRPYLTYLKAAEFQKLFTALINYSQFGLEPALEERVQMCFDVLRIDIDRDNRAYEEKKLKNRYAVYKRWAKEKGNKVLSYSEWLESGLKKLGFDTDEYMCNGMYLQNIHPIPTTTTASASASASATASPSASPSASESETESSLSSESEAASASDAKTRLSAEAENRDEMAEQDEHRQRLLSNIVRSYDRAVEDGNVLGQEFWDAMRYVNSFDSQDQHGEPRQRP
ncbi:MAG: hypothetical protein HUJ65_04235 [Oscillospiraceae bacterium]|nr:hypothetical protein [Oscillospiraceae bacterium]